MRSHRQDHATFQVLAELDGTEAISARFHRRRFRPHAHETYLVGATAAGTELFEARGGRHVSTPGALRFFNPGEVHTGAPAEGSLWSYRCLYPGVALMTAIGRELGMAAAPAFAEMVVPDPTLAEALLTALAQPPDAASRLERSSRLRATLTRIVAAHGAPRVEEQPARRAPRAVAAARTFIADNAAADFSLADLSRVAAMSPFHLLRVFKAATGLTPFAFQRQVRIGQARRMLAEGRDVAAVALACGFYDRSHLSRAFVATVGVSPTAYRAAVGDGSRRGRLAG